MSRRTYLKLINNLNITCEYNMDHINTIVKNLPAFINPKLIENTTEILQYLHDFKHLDTNEKTIYTHLLQCRYDLTGYIQVCYSQISGTGLFVDIHSNNTFNIHLIRNFMVSQTCPKDIYDNINDLKTVLVDLIHHHHYIISRS